VCLACLLVAVAGGAAEDGQGAALGGFPFLLDRHSPHGGDDRTAMAAPITGPAMYTHHPVKSVDTMSGPRVRAGFIDAPLMGLANKRSSATVATGHRLAAGSAAPAGVAVQLGEPLMRYRSAACRPR
jgi:hypothetical protein